MDLLSPEPSEAHPACCGFQTQGGFVSSLNPPGKLHVRRLRPVNFKIALQGLHDVLGLLSPARSSQINLTQAPHPVTFHKTGDGLLCRIRQGFLQITFRQLACWGGAKNIH